MATFLRYENKKDREIARRSARKCFICGRHTNLVVDHDHFTGLIRGVLCNRCNTAIGVFRDSPRLLLRAFRYLEMSVKEASRWEILECWLGPHLTREEVMEKIEDWKASGILNLFKETLQYNDSFSQKVIAEVLDRYNPYTG